jgi:hypothetical protein
METTSGELTDFCLVVAPDAEAVASAGDALRSRFTFVAERTRMELVEAVAERMRSLVERGSGRPITVAISLEPDAIHGQVSDQDEFHKGREARFEIAHP